MIVEGGMRSASLSPRRLRRRTPCACGGLAKKRDLAGTTCFQHSKENVSIAKSLTGGATDAKLITRTKAGTFSSLIRKGVKLENNWVNFQHKLLLGAPSAEEQPSPGLRRTTLYLFIDEVSDFCRRACIDARFFSKVYQSRLLVAALFCLVCMYANAVATMVSTHKNPRVRLFGHDGVALAQHSVLPDIGHDVWAWFLARIGHPTSYIDDHALPDRLVVFLGRVTICLAALHPRRFMLFRRLFTIVGLVLLMRAVSVTVTVLPDASPVCQAKSNTPQDSNMFPKVLLQAVQFVVSPSSIITCGDMVFSGHSSALMMCALTFSKYCRVKHLSTKVFIRSIALSENYLRPLRRLVYMYCMVGFLIIIGSRLHYTLDVVLAIALNYWTFTSYHLWARHAGLRRKIPMLEWLEHEEINRVDEDVYTLAQLDRVHV